MLVGRKPWQKTTYPLWNFAIQQCPGKLRCNYQRRKSANCQPTHGPPYISSILHAPCRNGPPPSPPPQSIPAIQPKIPPSSNAGDALPWLHFALWTQREQAASRKGKKEGRKAGTKIWLALKYAYLSTHPSPNSWIRNQKSNQQSRNHGIDESETSLLLGRSSSSGR